VRRVAGTAAGLVAAGVLLLAGTPPAIALGDVDHFKSINERVGHTAGDRVLQDVAATPRGSDLCFR
jgi:diguanylate cyclase (GGDEF)-like protein